MLNNKHVLRLATNTHYVLRQARITSCDKHVLRPTTGTYYVLRQARITSCDRHVLRLATSTHHALQQVHVTFCKQVRIAARDKGKGNIYNSNSGGSGAATTRTSTY